MVEKDGMVFFHLNPIALRTAKTLWSFGHSKCNRVKTSCKTAIFKISVKIL